MQQIICKTGCIQSVGGAIDSTAAQYTITAHVKLYNAVQSARLTVVLQKNVQTWSGTWDDIFVFSAGGAGSAALGARNAPFLRRVPCKDHRRCVRSGRHSCGYFHCVYSGTHCFLTQTLPHKAKAGKSPAWPFLIPVKLFRRNTHETPVSAVSCAHFPMDK